MAGLGKYHMGGYGRIGVYRVNHCLMCFIHLPRIKRQSLSTESHNKVWGFTFTYLEIDFLRLTLDSYAGSRL